MTTDYTLLVTSEHSGQPNFIATVALTANAIGDIVALTQSLPGRFDLDVAIGQQLDILGLWIGRSRVVTGIPLGNFFGFADDPSALTFGELGNPAVGGRFLELNELATASAVLGDPDYRQLLRAQIIQNGYNGNVVDYEAALTDLVPVPCLTFDPGNYVVMIVPTAAVDATTTALLTTFDVLPRPGGVRYQLVFLNPSASWTTVGTVTLAGTSVTKAVNGASAWDSSAFVQVPFNHLYLSWTVPDKTVSYFGGGLATNPAGSPNFATLTFGLFLQAGSIGIFESGVQQGGSLGGYNPGDTFAVYYDGKQAVYLHNSQILKVTVAAPGSLSPMFCLFAPSSVVNNISLSTG